MTDKTTALYGQHQAAGASFTDFGGWQMPLKYTSELAEHRAVREAAGLFDLSHMGEVRVSGPDAGAFLDYALAGKLSAVKVGRAKYSLITDADGGIIDDLISYRLADDEFLVVPNAGNATVVAGELAARAGDFDVAVTDESADTSLVAVQGPKAEQILLRLVPGDAHGAVTGMKYYAAAPVSLDLGAGGAAELLVARTGYTGEDGFEIYVPNAQAADLWSALLAAGADDGLVPAGLACRDSLRLEAGMPLYGNELNRDLDPYAAGLGPVVSLAKEGDFVGRAALEKLSGTEPARKLVGLKGSGRRSARSGYPVLADGRTVGEVTSGAPSPTLGYPIALAYVDAALAEPGTAVEVDLRGRPEAFEVVTLPFYRRDRS